MIIADSKKQKDENIVFIPKAVIFRLRHVLGRKLRQLQISKYGLN